MPTVHELSFDNGSEADKSIIEDNSNGEAWVKKKDKKFNKKDECAGTTETADSE